MFNLIDIFFYMLEPVILPIASGKGGVGKTIISSSLGLALSKMNKTVILIDLDLGGSNLHTCLGVKNNNVGIGGFIYKKENDLEKLIVKTPYNKLFLIPGDSLFPDVASIPYQKKILLAEKIKSLKADYVILDLGAGTSNTVLDFFLFSSIGIIVTLPEITSILNAYSFMKNLIFRSLTLSFKSKSDERDYIKKMFLEKIEGTKLDYLTLIKGMKNISEESYNLCVETITNFIPKIIINKGRNLHSLRITSNLRKVARINLNIEIEYIGYIPDKPQIPGAVLERKPALDLLKGTDFEKNVNLIAEKITLMDKVTKKNKFYYEENEDLSNIIRKSSI